MSHSPTYCHELYSRIPANAGKQQLELLVELLKSRTPGLSLVMQTTQKVLEIYIFKIKKKTSLSMDCDKVPNTFMRVFKTQQASTESFPVQIQTAVSLTGEQCSFLCNSLACKASKFNNKRSFN